MTFKEYKIKVLKEKIQNYQNEINEIEMTTDNSIDIEQKLIDIGFYGSHSVNVYSAIAHTCGREFDYYKFNWKRDLTIKDLISCREEDLLKCSGISARVLNKIKSYMDKYGVEFVK